MSQLDTDEKPNVLLIHCHDLGQYLGCYNHEVKTTNIDALAAQGSRFEQYYSTAPQCSPSRASIMTGRHPQRHGLLGITNVGNWELPEDESTLPMYLNDLGYTTCLFGVQHEVRNDPTRLGYDIIHGDIREAHDVVDRFEMSFEDLVNEEPFFASIGFFEPHLQHGQTDRKFRRDDYRYDSVSNDTYNTDPSAVSIPPYLPDEPEVRKEVADLQDLIAATVDEAVGRLRDTLQEVGIEDETLLIFTTDHGLALPRAKGTCYDSGLETALIMQGPNIPSGKVFETLLSNVDLLPTLLEIIGANRPDDIDGRSFAPLFNSDENYMSRTKVFASMTWHDVYIPMRAVRTNRYKYIRNFTIMPEVFMPADIYTSPAGQVMAREYYTTNRPSEELYDLQKDPHEQNNLVNNKLYRRSADSNVPYKYEGVLDTLRGHLNDWMVKTEDPILNGEVAAPDAT